MPIHVEKLADEPIIMATYENPIDYYTEMATMFARILALRETITDSPKYYVIIDMTDIHPGFSEIVHSLGEASKASKQRRADLPISLHLVGTGSLFEMIANALGQRQYGGYTAPLHTTLTEALAAIRAEIAAAKAV